MSQFKAETAVQSVVTETAQDPQRERHSFQTRLTDAWNISGNPNGGYALASSLRAVAELTPEHPDPISITTHYLRPSQSNQEAKIDVDVVRRGRRTSTFRSEMRQQGKARITSLVTMSDLGQWPDDRYLDIEPHPFPNPDECVNRSTLPQDVDLPILSRLDVVLDPAGIESGGSAEAVVRGWIRFADRTNPSATALTLFADAFPPSPLAMLGRVGWVPTVELTVHVRARPASGWIRARFEARDIGGGMLIEDGLLWDSSGTLVAQSRQLALLLLDEP